MLHLDVSIRTAVAGVLYTATDTVDGRTQEQTDLLEALAGHVIGVSPSDARVVSPEEAAKVLVKPRLRKSVGEILVTLELVRHPPSEPLTARVGQYIDALGIEDGFQTLAADYLANSRERVARDWERIRQPNIVESFIDDQSNAQIAEKMNSLADLPEGALGRALLDFYRRNGFALVPGDEPDQESLVPHDLTHVIAGYGATAEAEIALQAFMVGAARGESHFSSLLAALLLFEVGMLPFPGIEPTQGVLGRPGAAELFARAVERGLECHGDIEADHEEMLELPLSEVRAEFGIPEPEPGPHMFIL